MQERSTESVPADDPSAQILAAWPDGRVVADRYEIGPVLGVGGSSVIYRALDRALHQFVALKVLRRDRISPAATARLRREVAVTRNAVSPHLVRVFDIGVADTDTFVTMELIDGESLRTRLGRGPLPIAETLSIGKQLLRGLAALHQQKIVHRDIKPSNVLIDRSGIVRLADFGLAVDPNDEGDRPTQTGTLVGTAEYMSPEQVIGSPLDERSDLYSFGVLLYECLTGQLPFGSRSSVAALLAHVRERPRAVRELHPEVPSWLSRLTERLLAKDAGDRFRSADEVLRLLEEERAPRKWQPMAAIIGAVVVTLSAIAMFWSPQPRFARIAPTRDERGIEGLDEKGRVMWRRANIDLRHAAVVHINGLTRIAGLADVFTRHSAAERSKVLLLHPDTGKVDSIVTLPDPAPVVWPQFDDEFTSNQLVAADFDHDGSDQIIVPFQHAYWPSYIVVYDLVQRGTRMMFVHSGHAPFVATADVNGDGRDELLILGINNRMGWYDGLAAVDIPPIKHDMRDSYVFAGSPDMVHPTSDQTRLLWYQLLRPGYPPPDAVRVNASNRTISVRYSHGPPELITFDGFVRTASPPGPPGPRRADREAAYEKLRDVERFVAAGQYQRAEADSLEAARIAAAIADPTLAEWARRVHMRTLVRLERIASAEAEAEELVRKSSAPADSAWDLARELHLTGHSDAAFRWYRQGLYAGRDVNAGRMRYEFVEGAVLALGERQRWHDAEIFLEEARQMLPSFVEEPQYINYIRWKRGDSNFVHASTGVGDPDLARYWELEEQHVTGTRGAALLQRIGRQDETSSYPGLISSIKSVALKETGKIADARATAQSALTWCELHAKNDAVVRAHLGLVRQRANELGLKTSE